MRCSIMFVITVLALSLACSKKDETAPVEPEQAAETEEPSAPEVPEAADVIDDPGAATDFDVKDLPPLPPELGGETPSLAEPPRINVLKPGSEPRQTLRWTVKKGFEQKVTVDFGLGVDAVVVLLRAGIPKSSTSYDLTMKAKKVEDDGAIRVAFKVDRTGSHGPEGEETERTGQKNRTRGRNSDLVGSYTLSTQGGITDFEMATTSEDTPPDPRVVDALQWALFQMTPAFPTEAVGQGAKWTAQSSLLQGGILVNQLRTIELVKLGSKHVELAIEVRQNAAPQPYTNPLTGANFELETLNGIADGSLTWDLTKLAPLTADIDADALDTALYREPNDQRKASSAIHTERSVQVGER